jgi:predicted nucleotidyltransferase
MEDRGVDTQALTAFLARQTDVEAAWLFGSRARGTHRPWSDVDLAIVLSGPAESRARRRDAICADLMALLGRDDVDVVLFDSGSPLLRHRVVRDGWLLVARDLAAVTRWATDAVIEYLDTEPLRAAAASARRRRSAAGTFGRLPPIRSRTP